MESKKTLTVKEWADEDRPRERLLNKGKKELSNAELIAILLRSGLPGKSAVDMAMDILARSGNSLVALSHMDYPHFKSIKGMGEAKSTTLIAALELGNRMLGEVRSEQELIIGSSTDLYNYMCPLLVDLDHEEFWAIFLNVRNRVIHRQRISLGGQTESLVDLRILFRTALEQRAVRIAVAHNHPSGSLQASRPDLQLTEAIAKAGNLLQIKLIEHLIIAPSATGHAAYFSFHDEGLL